MKNISITKLNPNLNIIDIRDNYDYSLGHIYNSKNIPMNLLLNLPSRFLDEDKRYYIYCQSGKRSKICCELLTSMGYNVINVEGGYNSFI